MHICIDCNCANPPIKARVLTFTQARTSPCAPSPRSFHAHVPSPRRRRSPSALGTAASLPALAADELHYNQISLRAEASQEVARDLMIVTLYTEEQNTDPAKTRRRRQHHAEQSHRPGQRGQGHQSAPGQPQQLPDLRQQRRENHRLAWRAELRLESADFAACPTHRRTAG